MNNLGIGSTSNSTIFTAEYVSLLRAGDRETQRHFAWYFGSLVAIKVRNQVSSPDLIDEVRHQTLLRVLLNVRQNDETDAQSLGTLVNATCNRVLAGVLQRNATHFPALQPTLISRIAGLVRSSS